MYIHTARLSDGNLPARELGSGHAICFEVDAYVKSELNDLHLR